MRDPADYELVKGQDGDLEPTTGGGPPRRPWGLAAAALVVLALIAGYFLLRSSDRTPVPGSASSTQVEEQIETARPLGGEPMPGDVPPLDDSDAFVRELLRHLSAHPRVAAWLATDGLIRNFTVVTTNIADGRTPAQHLPVLRPAGEFRPGGTPEELRMDPRTYERYNDLAGAVESINASGTAEIYATLKPRIEEAHRELGGQNSFDATLERAIVRLLQTPIPQDPVRLKPVGIGYGFADDRLEGLSGAQKQLIRMGPRNAAIVQEKLREIALELGIPASRLPPE